MAVHANRLLIDSDKWLPRPRNESRTKHVTGIWLVCQPIKRRFFPSGVLALAHHSGRPFSRTSDFSPRQDAIANDTQHRPPCRRKSSSGPASPSASTLATYVSTTFSERTSEKSEDTVKQEELDWTRQLTGYFAIQKVTPRQPKPRVSRMKGHLSKRTSFVRDVVKEVAGYVPKFPNGTTSTGQRNTNTVSSQSRPIRAPRYRTPP